MSLQEAIKQQLCLKRLDPVGKLGNGGCVSQTSVFNSDIGRLFVKYNDDARIARVMFDGEVESLRAIAETGTVRVPHPLGVVSIDDTGSWCFVAEYHDLRPLTNYEGLLGRQLAELHIENMSRDPPKRVKEFGFHVSTCCGKIALDNSWNADWPEFFSQQRIDPQVQMVLKSDEELQTLWAQLRADMRRFFENVTIFPSLLHGDLWSGNAAETDAGPIIFDPASFYGHHEFDLAIARMFGGFGRQFYDEYHKVIPKEAGFESRQILYQVFHYLNHWNHFGTSYRKGTIAALKKLLASV